MENKNPANRIQDERYYGVGGFILEIIKIFLLAFIIIVPIRVFLFQPFFVQGASMEPNFEKKVFQNEDLDSNVVDRVKEAQETGEITKANVWGTTGVQRPSLRASQRTRRCLSLWNGQSRTRIPYREHTNRLS